MAKLNSINTKGMAKVKDTLGFTRPPTDIYICKIKNAYLTESQQEDSESQMVNLEVDFIENFNGDELSNTYSERLVICNRDGDAFYVKNGQNIPMPGFVIIDDICQILTEEGITEQDTEIGKVKIRDYDSGQDIPTKVEILADLVGEEIALAIQHRRENKRERSSDGSYQPTPEPVERNTIVHAFSAEDFATLREIEDDKEPEFAEKWINKYQGKINDTFKENVGGAKKGRPSGSKSSRGGKEDSGKSGRRGLSLGRNR